MNLHLFRPYPSYRPFSYHPDIKGWRARRKILMMMKIRLMHKFSGMSIIHLLSLTLYICREYCIHKIKWILHKLGTHVTCLWIMWTALQESSPQKKMLFTHSYDRNRIKLFKYTHLHFNGFLLSHNKRFFLEYFCVKILCNFFYVNPTNILSST